MLGAEASLQFCCSDSWRCLLKDTCPILAHGTVTQEAAPLRLLRGDVWKHISQLWKT